MRKYFAAYDNDTIHAIDKSPEDAIAKASLKGFTGLKVAKIRDGLVERIDQEGWDAKNQSFAIVDGYLVDTSYPLRSGVMR
jgi:hypothetical protein